MKIFLLSDLHIELMSKTSFDALMKKINNITDLNGVLILAGDITSHKCLYNDQTREFFITVNKLFEKVFYVMGNHEYYSNMTPHNKIINEYREYLKEYPNIILLDNEIYEHGEILFVGTTLWSKVTKNKYKIKKGMNDYVMIYKEIVDKYVFADGSSVDNIEIKNIDVDDTNKFNEEAVNFIRSVNYNKQCIMITHHAPLFGLADPKYAESEMKEAFHNDLSDMITPPIYLWCYGHTHYRSMIDFNGVTLWTNQLGYQGEIADDYDIKSIKIEKQNN